jgi:small conductance mechanosensitive channel
MDMEKFYNKAYDWILNIGPRLLIAIIVVIVGFWLIRIIKGWMTRHMIAKEFDPSLRPFLTNLIIVALQVMLVLAFMQIIGIQMTIFAAVVGAFGVAAGLALSGTLQNFTSGVLILLLKPFRVGEIIIAQGQEGLVTAIQIFFTTVTTFDNKTVIIPNSKLSNEVIINLSREGKRRLDIDMKFNFGIPFQTVQNILQGTVARSADLLTEPAANIGVSAMDPDGYRLMVQVWVKAEAYNQAKLDLQKKMIDDLKGAGIKLPGT